MPLILLLLACAARQVAPADDPGPVFVTVSPDVPGLCVSSVPQAGPLPDPGAWVEGLEKLQERDLSAAAAIIKKQDAHPGVEAATAAVAMVAERTEPARVTLRDLANTWREDACLQQAAAFAHLRSGATDSGAAFAAAAVALDPDEPEFILLDGMARRLKGEADAATDAWRKVLEIRPGHPQASALLAGDYLARGDALLALPLLEDAMAGGVDVSGLLAPAYFRSGRTGDYLRVASEAGWPLGDDGALATAEDTLAAYMELLGVEADQQLRVELSTSMGALSCELYWKKTPVTVANFVGLARGTQEWIDPRTGGRGEGPYYDGTALHRVIPEFMIQMGDPTGTGAGTPGYRFPDEIVSGLNFDRPGVMGMANNGPNANGGQFFITEVPARHLDGRHTIFGQCDEASVELVRAIARVPTGAMDKPVEPIVLESVRVYAE